MSALSTMAMGIKNYNDKYYARDHYCETEIVTDDMKTSPTINININLNFGGGRNKRNDRNQGLLTQQEKQDLTQIANGIANIIAEKTSQSIQKNPEEDPVVIKKYIG